MSMILSVFLSLVITLLIISSSICLLHKRRRLVKESYINTIGSLYSDLRIRKKGAVAFHIVFMLRRTFIAIIYTTLGENSAF